MHVRALILAAGQGTRLRPLTDDRPKCLVELGGRALLDFQVAALHDAGVADITVVAGYRAEAIVRKGFRVVLNPDFENTNMVASLFCARGHFEGDADLLICYGDIVYEPHVVRALLADDSAVAIIVDRQWSRYWERRMADPLGDAETLKLDDQGFVRELGRKPSRYEDIQGQYVGLIKVRADRLKALAEVYDGMDRVRLYDGKPFPGMFMTSFLQHLIDEGWPVHAVPVENGWLEIDTVADLNLYHSMMANGTLASFWSVPTVDRRQALDSLFDGLPAPRTREGCFATEVFLKSRGSGEAQDRILDRLCRAVDVKREVFAFYRSDAKVPMGDESLRAEYLSALAAILLRQAEAEGDAKLLNTALKLLDGIVARPTPGFPPFLAAWADELRGRLSLGPLA